MKSKGKATELTVILFEPIWSKGTIAPLVPALLFRIERKSRRFDLIRFDSILARRPFSRRPTVHDWTPLTWTLSRGYIPSVERIFIRVSSSYVDFLTKISRHDARQKQVSRHSQPLSVKLQPNPFHTSPDRQTFQIICAATEDPIKLFIQDSIQLRTQVSFKALSSRSSPVRFKPFLAKRTGKRPPSRG